MKLEYLFLMYDIDSSGYLDKEEIKMVLGGMISLLGNDKGAVKQIADECVEELDKNGDGKVSKSKKIKK